MTVDIWSCGEVVAFLKERMKRSLSKDCNHLILQKGYLGAYYSHCNLNWASHEDAANVNTDPTAYNGPGSYYWPRCPSDCPHFHQRCKAIEMDIHINSDSQGSAQYISLTTIEHLRTLACEAWDMARLVRACEELNLCYRSGCYLACLMLVRSIMDHVPPIFQKSSFSEVANNYAAGRSFKEAMQKLDSAMKPIANAYLHQQIRKNETLPTEVQVDFRASLDYLLQEVIRVCSE